MLIVCAGRSRSGSTLMYNLIRLTLVEMFGKSNVYGRGINFYKKNQERKYNIVKLHDSHDKYFEKNADYVFSCERNEADQRKSIVRFRKIIKNQKMTEKQLNEFLKYDYQRFKKWSGHKNFKKTFNYNMLVNKKENVVKEILRIFKFKPKDSIINSIVNEVNKLSPPTKKGERDPESCLIWNHITGSK